MIFQSDKDREIAYRNAFGTDPRVLVDILGILGFWETSGIEGLTPIEQNVLNLYAKKILMRAAGEEFGTIVARTLGVKKKSLFEKVVKWLKGLKNE